MTVEESCVAGVVHGRVQGVAFRASMAAEARRLGVAGWVRNRSDGCVEFAVRGPATAVEALVAWARRGPAAARVASLETGPAIDADALEAPFAVRVDA